MAPDADDCAAFARHVATVGRRVGLTFNPAKTTAFGDIALRPPYSPCATARVGGAIVATPHTREHDRETLLAAVQAVVDEAIAGMRACGDFADAQHAVAGLRHCGAQSRLWHILHLMWRPPAC